MRLTVQTDFALRTLMFLGASEGHQTIEVIARHYGISKNHLMKVAQRLVAEGYVASVRGRGGGLVLARPLEELNLGTIVRAFEDVGTFVECFDPVTNQCAATPACGLKHILAGGVAVFMAHLDQFSVADLVPDKLIFAEALGLPIEVS
ncbi:Rrf2 family transcriptional regulator [Sphingorhabdus sp.]|uniref:RrF2 family transcriptional regulator n=1 Tax=Sphingorhabdus sp. TaxID=1902408 RepID=UPI0035945053